MHLKIKFTILSLMLLKCSISFGQIKISGHVQDSFTGEKIINAFIYQSDKTLVSYTNNYGFFSIATEKDTVKITVQAPGYGKRELRVNKNTPMPLNIELSNIKEIKGVVIKGKTGDAPVNSTQMSTVNIPINQIKQLPRFFGETDVLKAIQLMPGIKGGAEGSTGLYVRGGGPDQNLMLLDGTPLYNVAHLFGFFSVFNADAINNVSVLKGGFPARYGGRLSSIVDITMKEGNMQKFGIEGSIGALASKMLIEGPILKNKASFLITGRRTYIDALYGSLLSAAQPQGRNTTSGYYFYDLNGKVNYKINANNRLYLSYYGGKDKYYLKQKPYSYLYNGFVIKSESDEGQKWGNQLLAARWTHIFNNNAFLNTQLSFTKYEFNNYASNFSGQETDTGAISSDNRFSFLSSINDLSIKSDLEITKNIHNLRFGGQAIYHQFTPGANKLYFQETGKRTIDTTIGDTKVNSLEFSGYGEDDIELNQKWKLNYGLHLNLYNYKDKFYFSPQPRIAARYLINKSFSIKGSYARMRQNIHLLTNNTIGLPNDLWVPATKIVKPLTADQIAIGAVKNLSRMFELTFETYYKRMENVVEYKEGASYLTTLNGWENKVLQGSGQSYGAELLFQKRIGELTGWIGYTLSYSKRNVPGVNNNETFYYKYDSRHDFSFVLTYKENKKYEYGLVWVFRTGNAITLPTAAYPSAIDFNSSSIWGNTNPVLAYSGRNNFRYANYHRLDLSFTKHYQKKWGLIDLNVSIYNTYSRINPFYYRIGVDNQGNKQIFRVGLFPILPSVNLGFKF